MNTLEKIAIKRAEYQRAYAAYFDEVLSLWCESPIEELFVAALLCDFWRYPESRAGAWIPFARNTYACGVRFSQTIMCRSDSHMYWLVQPTVEIGSQQFRPDFACLDEEFDIKIAVELDGHDFHERTKDQAARDKQKDRAFASAGWRVLRFTGSEVYESAESCVSEVLNVGNGLRCQAIAKKHNAATGLPGASP